MFDCRACKAKDVMLEKITAAHSAHITDLQKQVADYRALAIPPSRGQITEEDRLEADTLMSGNGDGGEVDLARIREQEEIDSEASRLLSGEY